MYPKDLQNLMECFKQLPGIGEKSAERLSMYCLDLDHEIIGLFSESIKKIKTNIKRCLICNNISDQSICSVCADNNREKNVICVVEEPKNVFQFEKLGNYNGQYHVLDGLISPLDNINPEDLKIKELKDRIEKENVFEIILAIKPSIEGETTALYISSILKDYKIKISKIAHGIPLGADMDYIDAMTLEIAFDERKIINDKIGE